MDNPEEVLHSLDEFAKLKPKSIPRELEDYLMYVARTGDPVYQWATVKILFREKLLNVITEFYETTPTLDVAPSPNVDPFNYETMKTVLLERLEAFSNAPFTVQRLCELLTTPRKEYNRPDKFMRAIEKNILVVSTRGPGGACRPDSALSEPIPNGVSEPSEAASNQSSSSNSAANNEETSEESSSEASPKETEENHVVAESNAESSAGSSTESSAESSAESSTESSTVMESNDVETDQAESSVTVSEEAIKDEEAASESVVKESDESPEATDSSDSVTYGDVNSAGEIPEAVNVTSTECVSNAEVKDIPEQPEICEAETSAVESVPLSSSSEVSSVGDEVLKADPAEAQSKADKEDAVSGSKEVESVSSDTPANEDEVTSEATSEPSVSSEDVSQVTESTQSICPKEVPSDSEPDVSSAQQDQAADSTASDSAQVAEIPTSEAVSSNSSDDSSEAVDSKLSEDDQPDTSNVVVDTPADVLKGSEAAPVVEKSESEVKESTEAAKADVDTNITSTEGVAGPEEAMDVDESSNQPSEASAGDSEAMEVAEDEEAMEVCEDSALEAMTTSPEETAQ
ncbi:serine/threonine-protein phosphatase 4 regulatory subunit 2 [Thrips palmi]|uniref:Serine/threonine-protein phosphatase 4 regulatory subunit 2 n=1 Tax=Thrips palmi TaxID=161013 RepID=A0A6P8YPQ0_THRPL|nr:serine/threonine-protein phosphatase 4 regulatory subunit 2 [Thrips palmi]